MFMLQLSAVVSFLFVTANVLLHVPAYGADLQENLQLPDETLLFREIPSVFGASKYEQKVTEAPSSVTILTAEDIEKFGYRTLGEAFLSLRGFYQSYDRMVAKGAVRGFGLPGDTNTRLLVLVDGQRTNDNIFESGSIASFDMIDVDLVDRIEIIRGPGSSLYGTNAVLSVINVITKQGRDYGGTELSLQGGSQERYKGRLTYGAKVSSDVEALFSASYTESSGDDSLYFHEFDSPSTNNGIAEDLDGLDTFNIFTKIALFDFALEGFYLNRHKDIPAAPYGVLFNTPGTEAEGIVGHLNLKYKHLFTNQVEFAANLTHNSYEENGDYIYEGPITNRDAFMGNWWGTDFQIGKHLERHRLIFGGEYRNNYQQDLENFDVGGATLFESRQESWSWGLFAQDEYKIHEGLILNAGLRHDQYDSFGGTTNPRIGLIYNPLDKTTLKLLYGRAFRAPNAFERYYHDGYLTWKPNPDLDPETIDTYEFVVDQYFGERWKGLATIFYYQMDDLVTLTLDPDDGLVIYQNIGEVEATGGELELEGKWNGGLEGRISYTYQEVEDHNSGERIANSPKHLTKLNLSFPVYQDSVFISIEEQYTSERTTTRGNSTGGFAVTNLSLLARELLPGLTLSASVYNLFDKKFSDPASLAFVQDTIEQDGIGCNLKLDYHF